MNLTEYKNLNKVLGEDVIKSLENGKIITWNNASALSVARFYRYKNKTIEYTDDLVNWKKSSRTLADFKDEWSNYEWLVIDK